MKNDLKIVYKKTCDLIPYINNPRFNDDAVDAVTSSIKNFGFKVPIVLDLFGGSGSTLVACETLGRSCYSMELDPKFVDVIIKRWEELTGDRAVLLEG